MFHNAVDTLTWDFRKRDHQRPLLYSRAMDTLSASGPEIQVDKFRRVDLARKAHILNKSNCLFRISL